MRSALARINVVYFSAILLLSFLSQQKIALSQTCGIDYVIKDGESLADIATRVYGNPSQWTLIFYANQDHIGTNAQLLSPGKSVRVPCVASPSSQAAALPASLEAAQTPPLAGDDMEISPTVRRIEFLTADGFAPFTDRALPNGGMITHIVAKAMDQIKERSGGSFSYGVSWINDWSAHLSTLLVTKAFDVGFPWVKPDCGSGDLSKDAKYRCQRFFFSDPVYEVFTVLFVQSGSTLKFAKDAEIIGKTLCQPANQSTYELDKGGRNWVRDNKIVLLRPQTLGECFKLLDAGSVSAVVTPDLTGKAAISALGLEKKIKALPRPVDIGTIHLIVPKTHPQASTILYYLNAAIARLRENGDYDEIVDKHLSHFWITAERK